MVACRLVFRPRWSNPNFYGRVSYIVIGRFTRFRWLAIKSFPKGWPISAKNVRFRLKQFLLLTCSLCLPGKLVMLRSSLNGIFQCASATLVGYIIQSAT